MGGDHFYLKFGWTGLRWSDIADFQPIFACSATGVTPSEKSSINTNRTSTTRFPMSLRWSSYVASKPPSGGSKRKTADFRLKSHFAWKKVSCKASLCENCHRQSCKSFIGPTNRAKMIGGATPSTGNFGSKWPRWSEIADFRSLFARSDSAVTPSEKSSINVNWSPLRAFEWAQDKHRTLSLSPQRVARKRNVSEIWTISCDNS